MMEFEDMDEVMIKIFGAIDRGKPNDLDIYLQRTLETFSKGRISLDNLIDCFQEVE